MKTNFELKISEIEKDRIVIKDLEHFARFLSITADSIGKGKHIGDRYYVTIALPDAPFSGPSVQENRIVFMSDLFINGITTDSIVAVNTGESQRVLIYDRDIPSYLKIGDKICIRVWF